jgi:transcriptional regulator with XRE-family HTH domain
MHPHAAGAQPVQRGFGEEQMTDTTSPVMSRRRLAAELRRLRNHGGHTLEDVAEHLECSPAKISRIESGQVGARVQDVREMLDFYGVDDDDRDQLLVMVRQAKQAGWWHSFSDVLPDTLKTLIGLEIEADSISTYENHVVPGLLQVPEYASGLVSSRLDRSPEDVDKAVTVRLRRQELLTRPEPPAYTVLIDEAVLHRRIGGPAVMDAQYEHLITMAQRTAVTLQVLPFSAGPVYGGAFAFVVLGFANLAEPRVVHVETLTDGFNLNDAARVGEYLATFDRLREYSLSPAQSVERIAEIRASQSMPASGLGTPG